MDALDRTDAASTGTGFKTWLADVRNEDRDAVGEFAPLYFIVDDDSFQPRYSFEDYASTMPDVCATEEDALALTEMLLVAEAQWRVERMAKERGRAALGLDVKTGDGVTGLPSRGRSTKRRSAAVLKCDHKNRAGKECGAGTVPGTIRCQDHGGALVDPEVRRSILMSAYTKLVEGADTAVDALIEVASSGRNELARVTASKEILDRAGLGAEQNITLKVVDDTGPSGIEQARDKLNTMRDRILEDPRYAGAIDATVSDSDTEEVHATEARPEDEPIRAELIQ